ncbi:hypothetical protein [Aristaeella lactis]|uniref:Uncharacterized protein n=1 Tax=Aristaeella lactis TaxID=3046383 RepID=A0AC61PKS6_9FIRM|nr:hypothetical protein [Aristaeella lactis]QUA52037.1 hypothetical protein JYE50_09945 [Aristaeella lactis]SMC56917.1 hypothetical protein SAMN06297397_1410 [Aristaeella lactis]
MRTVTKDIEIRKDGNLLGFRLFKLDAFSGVVLLRLLMRLEGKIEHPTMLDLIASLSEEELRSVMTAVLNHVSVLLPAGPQPVMTGSEWGYPELEHDTRSCMRLLMEGIAWSLSGFFGEGGSGMETAPADTSP